MNKPNLRSVVMGLAGAAVMAQAAFAEGEKFKVVTTFTIIADMARHVAGDAAVVESITKAGAEIHGYEPTPGDIIRAQDADLVLWNGLNLERWFEQFLANLGDVPSATLTDGIQPISITGGMRPSAELLPTAANAASIDSPNSNRARSMGLNVGLKRLCMPLDPCAVMGFVG